jgi:hypothetical protein
MHSMASVATAQVRNRNAGRPAPGRFGGGGAGDDASVMTGISAATLPMSNVGRAVGATAAVQHSPLGGSYSSSPSDDGFGVATFAD